MIERFYTVNTSSRDSRYQYSRRLDLSDGSSRIETANRIEIPERVTDSYHTVAGGEENRLDMISHRYYSSPLYWWVIAAASGVSDPFSVPVGTVLRIPSPTTVFSLEGVV